MMTKKKKDGQSSLVPLLHSKQLIMDFCLNARIAIGHNVRNSSFV